MLQLPNGQMPQQIVQMVQPFNEVQMVAMIAASGNNPDPVQAVEWAQELLAEALATLPRFEAMCQAAKMQMEQTRREMAEKN